MGIQTMILQKKLAKKATIDPIPESWTLTPWSHNWYKQEEWAPGTGLDFYRAVQMRRYGGDLDSVIEKDTLFSRTWYNRCVSKSCQ